MAEVLLIRKALADDMQDVLDMIRELAVYEKAPREVSVTVNRLVRDGFGDRPLFHVILAVLEGKTVGMAFYYFAYSTWKGKCIFLEDIIVKNEYRRQGIGDKLFREVIRISRAENAGRLMWQVLDWNEPALAFYRKYNAGFDASWINAKITRQQMMGNDYEQDDL